MVIYSFCILDLYISIKKISLITRNLNKIGLMEPVLSYEHTGIAQKHKKLGAARRLVWI